MNSSNYFINEFNYSSLYTETYFDGTFLSSATSFCYKYRNELFLITNYHVVSGRNAFTNEVLDEKFCAVPNKLVVHYYDNNSEVKIFEVDLSKEETVLNITYEKNGTIRHYDVVAIKIDNKIDVRPINTFNFGPDNILIGVTDFVFVLGYPKSVRVNYMPIWKLASIASEPLVDAYELPFFYIDTGTKEGMSGSPVLLYSNPGIYRTKKHTTCMFGGPVAQFLGIYSGRDLCSKEEEARLGIVWKEDVIIKTISLFFDKK